MGALKAKKVAAAPAAMKAMKAKKVVAVMKAMKAKRVSKISPLVTEEMIMQTRTKELKTFKAADLKELALSKGLEKGSKEALVASLLAFEAKGREAAQAVEVKSQNLVKQMKLDLETKGNDELKELCRTKGLALGGSKPDKVDRLLDVAKKEGQVDKALERLALEERRAELSALDKQTLLAACKKAGVDPLLKELMVERLVQHETMAK